jgi:hypothetical protein
MVAAAKAQVMSRSARRTPRSVLSDAARPDGQAGRFAAFQYGWSLGAPGATETEAREIFNYWFVEHHEVHSEHSPPSDDAKLDVMAEVERSVA